MPWVTADDGCDVFYETHGISGRRRVGPVARRWRDRRERAFYAIQEFGRDRAACAQPGQLSRLLRRPAVTIQTF
jgi:hypothetical protein